MQNINYRYIIVAVIFVFFGILNMRYGINAYNAAKRENVLDTFPSNLGIWKGQRIPMKDSVYRILETETVYVSTYENNSNQVTLAIVYYPEVKVDFHSPEACNSSSGDRVEKKGDKRFEFYHNGGKGSIVLKEFIVNKKNGGRVLYAYFYKTENGSYSDYFTFRIHLATEYLINKRTSGALISVSTPIEKDIRDSEVTINSFLGLAYPIITKYI